MTAEYTRLLNKWLDGMISQTKQFDKHPPKSEDDRAVHKAVCDAIKQGLRDANESSTQRNLPF